MSNAVNSKEHETTWFHMSSGIQTDDIFHDNLDHLQALEREALLRMELANSPSIRMAETKSDDPGLHSEKSSAPDELIRRRLLEGRLEAIIRENVEKEKRSLAKGIPLLFHKLCASYSLNEFERLVVMLLFVVNTSMKFKKAFSKSALAENNTNNDDDNCVVCNDITIGSLLAILCGDYRQQIANRRYFSVESRLIREEIILLLGIIDETTNILTTSVHLHERIVRFILGDDCFYDSVLKHVTREKSEVSLDQVIMPDQLKEDVVRLVLSFAGSGAKREALGIDTFYGYGTGLTLMFYGPAGTGKTMLAKALAKKLDKTIFTISLRSYSRHEMDDVIRCIFREARLRDGIVFFDECDDIFGEGAEMSRLLLIEVEKANCITILATNKPFRLDPSLERRITLKVPFIFPDEDLRSRIWRELVPSNVKLAPDVDLGRLARNYHFNGGLIKNTLFAAVSEAIGRNGSEEVVLNMCDLVRIADHQSVSAFDKYKLGKSYAPKLEIDKLPLRAGEIQQLRGLASAWQRLRLKNYGMNVMVKTADLETGIAAVEAIAFACDLRIRRYSLSEVLSSDSRPRFLDQQDQVEVSPLDYAFMEAVGHQSALIFVDYDDQIAACPPPGSKPKVGDDTPLLLRGFLDKLRFSHNFTFVVTGLDRGSRLFPEFHQVLELNSPPEDLQIKQWMKYLGCEQKELIVDLVESVPMHLKKIDFICGQAGVRAAMLGEEGVKIEYAMEILDRYREVRKSPILFGSAQSTHTPLMHVLTGCFSSRPDLRRYDQGL